MLKGSLAAHGLQLPIAAERVGQAHLRQRAAFRLEERRICHDEASTVRPRSGDIEPVQAVDELHAV